MRSVGQILQQQRLNKGFNLQQVERATKIRLKFLQAIEADDYRQMPDMPYIQGFIKTYCDFLDLAHHTVLALFRRQYHQKQTSQRTIEEPIQTSRWRLTRNKVIFTLIGLLILFLTGYFYNQYQLLHRPPPLHLANPSSDQIVEESTLAVFGDTDADATITINNEPVLVKEDGKFYQDITLSLGNNTLLIEATSRTGQKTTLLRKITYIPPD